MLCQKLFDGYSLQAKDDVAESVILEMIAFYPCEGDVREFSGFVLSTVFGLQRDLTCLTLHLI